ncbi:MAG: hypothetical protein HY369_02135 [Candidatus Aenigmarchaeota archaeon]|nr:hypothetical protein [Candidatus Aenigmarchaeota archaeon]
MDACLLDADYVIEDNRPVVRLWCVDTAGKPLTLQDRSFLPSFYVEPKDGRSAALAKRLAAVEVEGYVPEAVEEVTRTLLGKEKLLLKVTVRIPMDVPKFRDAVKDWDEVREAYEYDLPLARRYLIERGLVPLGWFAVRDHSPGRALARDAYPPLRVLAFDIEVIAGEVVAIGLAGTAGTRTVIATRKAAGTEAVANERALLERFLAHVRDLDPDLLVGYNSDQFDLVTLAGRAAVHGLSLGLGRDSAPLTFERRARSTAGRLVGRIHLDLFPFVERILASSLPSDVLTLDQVARELIGRGKEPVAWEEIERAWTRGDPKPLTSHCLRDAELTLELAERLLPQLFELCRLTGQTPFDASRMFYSQLVEWLYIRRVHEAGGIAPNRPKYDEIQRRRKVSYLGGYVHQPREGIHERIAVFDFASLYPSITITHNISPETLDCACCPENTVPDLAHHFCTKTPGFIPSVLRDLVVKRIEAKEALRKAPSKVLESRQQALKILANASYGYYAYPGSRWYSKVCAESITSLGRMYITGVISLADRAGYEVIYGDTDSLFLKMPERDAAGFLERVNDHLPGMMELDFKGFYPSGIFVLTKGGVAAKKRYALVDKKGEITVRGFERVRRDWSGLARETQQQILEAVLKDRKLDKAVRIVRQKVKAVRAGTVSRASLVIHTQLTKPLEEYEQVGPHVAVAKKLLARGRPARPGDVISYVVLRGEGSISERAEPADQQGDYDPDYYVHHQVVPVALRVLGGLGVTEEDLVGDTPGKKGQRSLKKYIR